jgi:hypothetical protein
VRTNSESKTSKAVPIEATQPTSPSSSDQSKTTIHVVDRIAAFASNSAQTSLEACSTSGSTTAQESAHTSGFGGAPVPVYVTKVLEENAQPKLVDIGPHEDKLRVPLHKQDPCRFCGRVWYLSEGLLQFHRDKRQGNEHWKSPTSCPECRRLSAANAASRRSNCPSSKVEFETKAEAEKYERFNREKHNSAEQYVYYCAKCHNYHMTTHKPTDTSSGALASPLGRAAASVPPAPVAAPAAPAPAGESRELAACRMYREGALTRDIETTLNAAAPTIYQWLKKHNVPLRSAGRSSSTKPTTSHSPFRAPVDLDTEEARLLAQLEEIRRKRQMLEEAKRLRVELVGTTAFRITKEGEHATLPLDELEPLIEQLMSLVPQTEQQTEPVLETL